MMTLPNEQQQRSPVTERVVEICQGPDCFGSGGGAVLLEIEDLVAATQSTNTNTGHDEDTTTTTTTTFRALAGGCRNFCTMGPNVHFDGNHFTKVDSVEACRKVATEIGLVPSSAEMDAGTSSLATATIMHRRKDRIRWQELRKAARKLKRKPRDPVAAAPSPNVKKNGCIRRDAHV